MGRRKIEDPAAELEAWLTDNGVVRASTAEVYASTLRGVVADLSEPQDTHISRWRHIVDQERVDSLLTEMWKAEPRRFRKVRPAWKQLRRWGQVKGIDVAPFPDVRRAKTGEKDLPLEVLQAVHFLSSRRIFSLKVLSRMLWGDVGPKKGSNYHVRDPSKHGTLVMVPASVVDILRTYAAPADEVSPLIPREPTSREAYTARGLENEMARYRRNYEVEDVDPIDDQINAFRQASQDGSALGSSIKAVTPETYQGFKVSSQHTGLDLASAMAYDPDMDD